MQLVLVDSFKATAVPIVQQTGPDVANRPPEPITEGTLEDLGTIGHGGMAEVRRVRDTALNRIMAMKVIHAPLLEHPSWISRFIEEAQATAQLQHPGIIPIHQIGQLPDGRHYFTMPEVRGRTLREVIARHFSGSGDWNTRGLIGAFRQICEAVAYAHARGVVHRDLKPANIMIGDYGEVFVLDWGIAKILGGLTGDEVPVVTARSRTAAHVTQLGVVAGTPSYMPPEQATRGVRDVDERADVYALGAILYELMSGKPPFDGEDEDEVLEKVRTTKPPTPRGPDELVEICLKAMERDPANRYADADGLAADINAWLDGARHRENALDLIRRAEEVQSEGMSLSAQAVGLRIRADAALALIPETATEGDKAEAWGLLDRATQLDNEAARCEVQREQLLNAVFTHCPDLPEAHAALAEIQYRRHLAAEPDEPADAAKAELLLREHTSSLPVDHAVRRRFSAYLQGDGALTLITDPPGAQVQLYEYQLRNRRKVAVPVRHLGRTPLREIGIPMGSYVCKIEAVGRAVVWYPIEIGRLHHWCGIGPGETGPTTIRLPRPGLLDADESLMPAGWFQAGPDRQKVWVDATVVKRSSVTNAEYIAFLNALASNDRLEEAIRYAPRERAAAAQEGALIYGLKAGRFRLQPDADGDLWQPDWPVLMVDWWSAKAFADWTAERSGRPWRLGTELEWEKAARGVDGRRYPWGEHFDPSWACTLEGHTGPPLPRSVGKFAADSSPYGIVGMAGNAQDWCSEPTESDQSNLPRPVRGGGWGLPHAPLVARSRQHPSSRDENTGFRLFFTPDKKD